MKVTTARRISQIFFLLLFVWLCAVSTSGTAWYQKGGWPVNWVLQLDPLVAVGVALAAGALTLGLLWALATITLTVLFGRAFCGWLCPFGTLHQYMGWVGRRGKPIQARLLVNRYRPWQSAKYYILIVVLAAAGVSAFTGWQGSMGSLLTGLLDPIPLMARSVNLVALPILDHDAHTLWTTDRLTDGVWVIGTIFIAALLLNLWIPRFYCRFVCPTGALLGVLSRVSILRVGRRPDPCTLCGLCEANCEGACSPATQIRSSECVMCLNCLDDCHHDAIGYSPIRSPGEIAGPDISRRGVLMSLASGLAAAPLLRLGGTITTNWPAALVRPPGSLAESRFLKRCIKCGQCMRVCPTNVIQPAGMELGFENLWTPVLNNRIGTSGCQLNCVACGGICPTGAIRPITLAEKLGAGEFAERGPIRMGTAFVDRGRCLAWAMDRPCIVCQEVCPVSPKAIGADEAVQTVRNGVLTVRESSPEYVVVSGVQLEADIWSTGHYTVKAVDDPDSQRRRIVQQTADMIRIDGNWPWDLPPAPESQVIVEVHLKRPVVDPARCIGCGVCEHECPVSGQRAIRVTAENESRSRQRSLLL